MIASRFMPKDLGDYRAAWIFSFLVAITAAPFVVAFKQTAPWIIAIPIALGAAVILIYEFCAVFSPTHETDLVVTIPSGFSGMLSYEQMLALEIHPKRKIPKE